MLLHHPRMSSRPSTRERGEGGGGGGGDLLYEMDESVERLTEEREREGEREREREREAERDTENSSVRPLRSFRDYGLRCVAKF